jgi:hypothetical protein
VTDTDLASMIRLAEAIAAGHSPRVPISTQLRALAQTVLVLADRLATAGQAPGDGGVERVPCPAQAD